MRLIDLHSHWGTRKGYPLRTAEALAQQKSTWNSTTAYVSEDDMAAHLRESDVSTILDLGFTKSMDPGELTEYHDYAFDFQRANPDVVLGHWLQINPRLGQDGVEEFKRRLQHDCFVGLAVSGTAVGIPASDRLWEPFYQVCMETGAPVLILVGFTGSGAGLPGGEGMLLEHCHPHHVDRVAATHPGMHIVAGRPAWPWQTEMIAVLLHKREVWNELHGWSPKYFTADLVHEISRRLSRRVMFGSDYPLFSYERLVSDWQSLNLPEDVLARVFHDNARSFLRATRPFGEHRTI